MLGSYFGQFQLSLFYFRPTNFRLLIWNDMFDVFALKFKDMLIL